MRHVLHVSAVWALDGTVKSRRVYYAHLLTPNNAFERTVKLGVVNGVKILPPKNGELDTRTHVPIFDRGYVTSILTQNFTIYGSILF